MDRLNALQILADGEYERSMEVQGMLVKHGFRVISVIYPNGSPMTDILVDPSGPVEELNGKPFTRVGDQQIWQAWKWGVRIRWILPIEAAEPPPEVFLPMPPVARPQATRNHHGLLHRLGVWLFGEGRHAH